uniref:ATPase AAA-type core domain-containing protein n=1 Tax=viral metagenome TaxID=1070528 RepID=A0A6C0E204_9ZZZZ
MNQCQYIFKKGAKKNTKCTNQPINQATFCSKHIQEQNDELISTKLKIMALETSPENKHVMWKHYKNMSRLESSSTEYYKNKLFLDGCLSYPWNKFYSLCDKLKEYDNVHNYIQAVSAEFDDQIYGMPHVKNELVNFICKFISNPLSTRNNIALHGVAGVGKNKIISAFAKILGIPMQCISLGGIKDSSFFLGHGYVYVESGPGKIIQNVINSKVTNPLLYFDELDKVSNTDSGKDVFSFLTYLTDPAQNKTFTDHYFYGMHFDLSKVLFVFSFNDISKIDPVLLDRLNIVHIPSPNNTEKVRILQNYCIPEICTNIGIQHKIIMTNESVLDVIKHCDTYIDANISSGIRECYRILEKIVMEINKDLLLNIINIQDGAPYYLSPDFFKKYFDKVIFTQRSDNTSFMHMYI